MKNQNWPECTDCPSRKDSLFNTLNKGDLAQMSGQKTCNVFRKGQVVFYEGNQPMGLYCVNQGKIKIYKMGKTGKEQIVRMAKPGDLLGYRSLIGEDVYTATAEALEDSVVCFLDRRHFEKLMEKNTDLTHRLLVFLCNELRDAENYIQSMAQKSVRERLAEVLLILKRKYGMDHADKNVLGVSLTREDLANITGTAVETTIRLLSDMREEEILAFEGRKIRILNHARLVEVANLDY